MQRDNVDQKKRKRKEEAINNITIGKPGTIWLQHIFNKKKSKVPKEWQMKTITLEIYKRRVSRNTKRSRKSLVKNIRYKHIEAERSKNET